jgi:UDP-N-acetylmuramoylalanine--D-glutamate ligase
MKVAVIGLGMEGKNAVESLLNYGHQVYASDLKKTPEIGSANFPHKESLDIDLGCHDWGKINSSDAVVLSPSLWNTAICSQLKNHEKFLSNILTSHKSVFTIGVTGTNGKTTTCFMIKEILDKAGFKVLMGGNAGGGFDGYTKIILEASENDYDIIIVEICDMTLDFCSYTFDLDLAVVTNLGLDHMDVHQSLENYQKSLQKFLNGKKAVLNRNDKFLSNLRNYPGKTFFFGQKTPDLNFFGKFNLENAAAAIEVAKILKVPEEQIMSTLANFDTLKGRTTVLDIKGSRIIIGKTDNVHAAAAVFQEEKFDLIIIGTPRRAEEWRYHILKEVSQDNPPVVGLFPGLDNTTTRAEEVLRKEGYKGEIKILSQINEVVELIINSVRINSTIFVGGNGQDKIMEIQEKLKQIKGDN